MAARDRHVNVTPVKAGTSFDKRQCFCLSYTVFRAKGDERPPVRSSALPVRSVSVD